MKNFTFNGVCVKGLETQIKLSKVDLNPNNPRSENSQRENSERMCAVYSGHIGYDSSQPIVVTISEEDRYMVIRGNGRIGGAFLLEEKDATRFTEVFGSVGKIPAIVLDCPTDVEMAIIAADHNGVGQRKQSVHEQYLSVRLLIKQAEMADSKETRKKLGELHGRSGSWAQSYQYLSELEDLCQQEGEDWPCNPFDVFVEEAMAEDKIGKLRIGHVKDLRAFWITGIDAGFWTAFKNLRRYGQITEPESSEPGKPTEKENSVFLTNLIEFFAESVTMKSVVDALSAREFERFTTIDAGCLVMEKVVKTVHDQETQEIAESAVV